MVIFDRMALTITPQHLTPPPCPHTLCPLFHCIVWRGRSTGWHRGAGVGVQWVHLPKCSGKAELRNVCKIFRLIFFFLVDVSTFSNYYLEQMCVYVYVYVYVCVCVCVCDQPW